MARRNDDLLIEDELTAAFLNDDLANDAPQPAAPAAAPPSPTDAAGGGKPEHRARSSATLTDHGWGTPGSWRGARRRPASCRR